MRRGSYAKMAGGLAWIVFLALGLALTSCGGNEEATAQGTIRIKTFTINLATLRIETSTVPTVDVSDAATKYTLTSGATVRFDDSLGTSRTLPMITDEVLIERPGASLLTVICDSCFTFPAQ